MPPCPEESSSDPQTVDRYAVVGHPVEHSRSPQIHALFAAATGQRLQYARLPAPLDGFEATVRAFAAAGGRGCNVTVPFKAQACALAARWSERVALAQSANTLRFDAEGWWADNTDGVGLLRDITGNAQTPVVGRRILLLGAGGAAAGALGPLIEAEPQRVVVLNRTVDKAQSLVARHQAWARRHRVVLQAAHGDAVASSGDRFDIVINATAASLAGAPVPISAGVLAPAALVLDMMYGCAAAPFLQWAHQHGARGRDGLGMLVEQAAHSFWLWRGVHPPTAPVLAALRA